MSEYQYYEFQAVDRPLTTEQMRYLRRYSSRADITATRFVNDYSWGDFRGNVTEWMKRYFDAFLYFANWGTRELQLRLPARGFDPDVLAGYCSDESFFFHKAEGNIVFTFVSKDETGRFSHELEGTGLLSSLVPLRSELAQGDWRALYLGWLVAVQCGERAGDDAEPPVPPGLKQLSIPLQALADFLRIDSDLLHIAAETSAPLAEPIPPDEIAGWIAGRPGAAKDEFLVRLMLEPDNRTLPLELLQSFREARAADRPPATASSVPRRTAGVLWQAAEARTAQRTATALHKAALEKAKREQAEAEARARHLDSLAGQEAKLWSEIDRLVVTRLPVNYDQAVHHLVDLRDLAARGGEIASAGFAARLEIFRAAHARKPSLLARVAHGVSNVARVS